MQMVRRSGEIQSDRKLALRVALSPKRPQFLVAVKRLELPIADFQQERKLALPAALSLFASWSCNIYRQFL